MLKMNCKIGALIIGSVMLSGCVAPVLVGGAAVTTATVVTDRRTAGAIVSDEVIEQTVYYDIKKAFSEQQDKNSHISVTSYDGKVLLSGEVPNYATKELAGRTARSSTDVASVVNELAVMPTTSATQRLSDSLLATKVRTALIGTKQVSLNQMKVTVDRGIVYLMGIVTEQESRIAAKRVSEVSGVVRVVKLFSVESEAEVARRLRNVKRNDPEL